MPKECFSILIAAIFVAPKMMVEVLWMITVPLHNELLKYIEFRKPPSPLRPKFDASIIVDSVFDLFLQNSANLSKWLMIRGFFNQKVLLTCILEISIFSIWRKIKHNQNQNNMKSLWYEFSRDYFHKEWGIFSFLNAICYFLCVVWIILNVFLALF